MNIPENNVAEFCGARYIKATQTAPDFNFYDPAPLFRKVFNLDEEVKEAKLMVQSPGFAGFYVNGKEVTADVFISPFSNYDKLLWYSTYDVTALLQKGENCLGVIAGNGFLNESFDTPWHYDKAAWRDAPKFLLCLKVNGKAVVISDENWKTDLDRSHIIFNHLRSGEHWDARKKDDSWLCHEYDDSDWKGAIVCEKYQDAVLRPILCSPVREVEQIAPISITQTDRGYLVDFGVTMSGYMQITLQQTRGSEIRFYYAEDLDETQAPKHNHMDQGGFAFVAPFHMGRLIASGGVDVFKPKFTYYGFRYVLIEGLEKEPKREDLCAYFVHNDVRKISDFSCGNEVLNYIYNAGIRSTYSNMFWCMTDCPTREKLGWTNDAQATVEQALINFDIVSFYERWFEDIKSVMREDGALPGIVPSPGYGYTIGPVCDCLLYEIPYQIYRYTGRTEMMIKAIPYFEKYVDYLEKRIRDHAHFDLGDWMGHENSPLIPKEFVLAFYLLKAFKITALANKLAHKDSAVWMNKLKTFRTDFLNEYLNESGRCKINEQTSIAMMIVEGLYRDQKVLADQLVEVVLRDKVKLTSGMVGVQYLYDALAQSGRPDLAYRLMTESDPGYKTWYESGATTLWEAWDGKDNGSHNHHMFSCVIAWFYKSLLGIAPMEESPAFEKIELSPCFIPQLGFAKGSMHTVKGEIKAGWKYEKNQIQYRVILPIGIKASFRGQELTVGENCFVIGI